MANPRQRRKAKSSAHKIVSHSKRAKRLQKKMPAIRGPKVLQDAWDPSKTVRQNYLALGLRHDLNPIPSGGSEVDGTHTVNPDNTRQSHPAALPCEIESSPAESEGSTLPRGFGRIIRDSSGNVVRVELRNDEEAQHVLKREPVIDAPVMISESESRIWVYDRPETSSGSMEDTIGQDLKDLAASATVRERHTSLGEKSYLQRLVNKYGDDLNAMARDRRLNPAQRTANELKRAIAKTGGLGVHGCEGYRIA